MIKRRIFNIFCNKKGEEDTSMPPWELINIFRALLFILIIIAIWLFIRKYLK